KCAMPGDHPLAVRLPWSRATSDLTNMESFMSPLLSQADGALAIGCRFSQTFTGSWSMPLPPSLAQIDIDPAEIGRHYPVELGICADASIALRGLLAAMPENRERPWASIDPVKEPAKIGGMDLIPALRRVLPRDSLIAADVTQLGYSMLAGFPMY